MLRSSILCLSLFLSPPDHLMSPDTLCFIANYLTQSIIGFTVISHALLYLPVGVHGLHRMPEGMWATTHKVFVYLKYLLVLSR